MASLFKHGKTQLIFFFFFLFNRWASFFRPRGLIHEHTPRDAELGTGGCVELRSPPHLGQSLFPQNPAQVDVPLVLHRCHVLQHCFPPPQLLPATRSRV